MSLPLSAGELTCSIPSSISLFCFSSQLILAFDFSLVVFSFVLLLIKVRFQEEEELNVKPFGSVPLEDFGTSGSGFDSNPFGKLRKYSVKWIIIDLIPNCSFYYCQNIRYVL